MQGARACTLSACDEMWLQRSLCVAMSWLDRVRIALATNDAHIEQRATIREQ